MSNLDRYNIVPAVISDIEHRSECLPYYNAFWSDEAGGYSLAGAYLPIFTAPMACVVNDKNYLDFDRNSVIPIIPRTVSLDKRYELMEQQVWVAFGLDEFIDFVNNTRSLRTETFICIDVANGHMRKLLYWCNKAKLKFKKMLILMAGNVANVYTYDYYAKANIDYIRCSVGSGGACLTDTLTGIGVANMGEFIKALRQRKNSHLSENKFAPKIVIDGGLSSIRDIIIALALGADYVMCGKIFAKAKEAAGELLYKREQCVKPQYFYNKESIVYPKDSQYSEWICGRMYYGMSTERAQREMGNSKIKHAEGKEEWVEIEYTLKDWVNQFNAAISSTMSYCNTKTLEDFIGKVTVYNS